MDNTKLPVVEVTPDAAKKKTSPPKKKRK